MRALILATALGAALATTAAGPPDARAGSYGTIAVVGNGVPGSTVEERAARYRRLAGAGVDAVRVDLLWVRVEPVGPPLGDYDFTDVEREVRAIRSAGLDVIGILGFGHPDHSLGRYLAPTPLSGGVPPFGIARSDVFPPADPRPYAAYARAVAEHLGDDVAAWEVWNEQNSGWRFWPPKEDPAAYGRLLCAAAAELRAVDPRTPVVFGGLFFPEVAGLPGEGAVDFLDMAYSAHPRIGRCYDVLAYHPYAYPFTAPELDVPVRGSVLSAADQLRAVLRRHDDSGKPLWITESGWPSNERAYGVSERKQAQYVARMAAATFAQGVPLLTFYTYGDEADPTRGANQEAAFGFFRADESPKPAYTALSAFTATFRGARFAADRSRRLGLPAGAPNTGGRGFALEYRRGKERLTAAWLAVETVADGQGPGGDAGPGAERRIELALPVRARAEIVDLFGGRRVVAARDGRVRLQLGPAPQYVIDGAGPRRCDDRRAPVVWGLRWRPRAVSVLARDRGCAGLRRVLVAVGRRSAGGRCRFLGADGELRPPSACRRPRHLPALRGRGRTFRLSLPAAMPSGRYDVRAVALDRLANVSRPVLRRAAKIRP